jgi:localization factor PodJL
LAESYKWFFLAAKEGDQDAAQKRDEIASRIDKAALAAARAAAESWTAIPQPADAIAVKGVWDPPQGTQPAAKPKPRSAKATPRDVSKVNRASRRRRAACRNGSRNLTNNQICAVANL